MRVTAVWGSTTIIGYRIVNKMNIHKKKNEETKNNSSQFGLKKGNPGEQKWCPPILMPNPNTGFARVDGPGGPVGDPPTHLDPSGVSEGTL